MTVSYTAKGETFAAGKPQPWMETRLQFRGSAAIWDLAPDGKRIAAFIGSDPGGEEGADPPDASAELLRRVATECAGGEIARMAESPGRCQTTL